VATLAPSSSHTYLGKEAHHLKRGYNFEGILDSA